LLEEHDKAQQEASSANQQVAWLQDMNKQKKKP
jgi:hypothetical protein